MSYRAIAEERADRRHVSVQEYIDYQRDGYLVVKGLVSQEETESLKRHAMDLLEGRELLPGMEALHTDAPREEKLKRFTRIHMLHHADPWAERYLLHPRILDVLEALIGPDVLSLQTMLFFNPPGTGGQGWHQDSYYITTYPDTLVGTWLALETADEENGCLWVAPGSKHEPIYPDSNSHNGFVHSDGAFSNLDPVKGISVLDDEINTLSPVSRKYSKVSAPVEAGDVIFFNGHLLHRSHPNRTETRWRRAFVSHYCNARSWVPWNHGIHFEGEAANDQHILARGSTNLPYAKPKFGTPCAALNPPASEEASSARMMAMDGEMLMMK
jgi:chlorinating enzyme